MSIPSWYLIVSMLAVSRSVTYLDPTAFPATTIITYGTLAPTEAPTAGLVMSPTAQNCSCSSCCGCSHVIIPTDVTSIEDYSFIGCGGVDLEAVIIST